MSDVGPEVPSCFQSLAPNGVLPYADQENSIRRFLTTLSFFPFFFFWGGGGGWGGRRFNIEGRTVLPREAIGPNVQLLLGGGPYNDF